MFLFPHGIKQVLNNMSSPIPLQNDKHAKLKVVESGDYTRYKDRHLIPIITQDFFTLAAEFPLVFVKNNETDEFVPVAIMGLREGVNLYCQTEQWPALVIPTSFTNSPFGIAKVDPAGEQFAVMIEPDNPLLGEEKGEALFKEDGERTEYFERRVESLVNVAQQTLNTQAICKHLAEMDLFMTQQLQLRHRPDAPSYNIDGIYTVSEEKLNALSDEDYLELRKRGLLGMIYAHLTSLQQFRRVSKLQFDADKAAGAY
jgi:hypothetical protein